MKKKKAVISVNYLDNIPARPEGLRWNTDKSGIVTLEIENKGIVNKIAQVVFLKPKVSFIHLDKFGSFVWQEMDGKRDITSLGVTVEEHFGDEAKPLYERLATFIRMLDSYGFVSWNENPDVGSANGKNKTE